MKIKKLIILIFLLVATVAVNAQNAEQGLRVGAKAPDFTLKDQKGNEINLYQLLKQGPVVLKWYRGGWCPLCNLELKGLADKAAEISGLGASLVAISPELPDKVMSTVEKEKLNFSVVSDVDNVVGSTYDLVYKLDEKRADRYEKGFGLSQYNGNTKAEVPLPATYIIDQSGIIRYAFVDPDYTKRANVNDVMLNLTQLVQMSNNNN